MSSENDFLKLDALTPKDNLSPEKPDFKVYRDALNGAFQNTEIRNLALSGCLGAGKSSIIRSFDQTRNKDKKHFLYVSLMDFAKSSADNNRKQYDQRELEYSLLNQILSHCTSRDLPEGSISGVPEKYPWLRLRSFLLSVLSLVVYVMIFHERFGALAGKLILIFQKRFGNLAEKLSIDGNTPAWVHLFFYVLVGVILACGVYCVSRRCLPFFRLSKLTLKSNVAEAEVSLGKERTTLDAYKFELAYILERIGPKHDYTVVFEDLERIDSGIAVDIMGKLRELNILTNNHLRAVYDCSENFFTRKKRSPFQPIRFVYAIDERTMPVEYRSKFYDCIIPVVPVSHPINGENQFQTMLGKLGIAAQWQSELCYALSDAFVDYRTRLTLQNEFRVLHALCKAKNEEAFADDTRNKATVLAITAYKVLLPEWFELALSPNGNKILPDFTRDEERKKLAEYLKWGNREKTIDAIDNLFRKRPPDGTSLLDDTSLGLILGEHELVDQQMIILRNTLDQDTFVNNNEESLKKSINALADVFAKTKADPTKEPYADFREVMTKRLYKLTSKENEPQFILVANSLAAVSRKDVAEDWAWLTPDVPSSTADEDKKRSSKLFFTRYVQFLIAYQQDSPEAFKDLTVLKKQDWINFCISSLNLMQVNDMCKHYNWTDAMGRMLGSITIGRKLPEHLQYLSVTESNSLLNYCSF